MSTVVLFARAPVPGSCKTRLVPALGAEGAARLYAAMLKDCLADFATLKAGRHVLYSDGELVAEPPWELVPQPAGDLGVRLSHALRSFAPPLLFLGSDAPLVPLAPLAAWLETPNGVALGKAHDGGYWALGLATPHPELFRDIPWGTSRVFERTLERCAETNLEVRPLPESFDVDTPDDLVRLKAALARNPDRAPHTRAEIDIYSTRT